MNYFVALVGATIAWIAGSVAMVFFEAVVMKQNAATIFIIPSYPWAATPIALTAFGLFGMIAISGVVLYVQGLRGRIVESY